jgi:hypothetical protein
MRPRLGVVEHLPDLLGADRQVDGADETKRRALDEVQLDAFAWLHGHPR